MDIRRYLPWISIGIALGTMILTLWLYGRVWFCGVDSPSLFCLWSGDTWSKHNSQHLFDPYAFTHLLHGMLFFLAGWLFWKTFLKRTLSFVSLLVLTVVCAVFWEIVENSSYVIELYRSNTASLEYYGDSILNSVGDVIAAVLGYIYAYHVSFIVLFVTIIAIEILLAVTIRDNLILNVIMLAYPIEAIQEWQLMGR